MGELAAKLPEAKGIELVDEKGKIPGITAPVEREKSTSDVVATFFGEF